MLASSVKRRVLGAICVAALIYSLLVVVSTANRNSDAGAIQMTAGAMISNVSVTLTNTAAADYQVQPGASPAMRLIAGNQAVKNGIISCAGSFSCEKTNLQSAAKGHGDSTFVIGPGYSRDTDFQIMSGTQLPVGFRYAGRGGIPGNSGSNPVNNSGANDTGTATARVCYDGVFIGGFGDTCKFARQAASGDTISGEGAGGVNCPRTWNSNAETSYGRDGTNGIPHITMLTNDAGPVNRTWGPVPPGGYADPKGQLWDVRRQRYAYARWTVVGCAGLTVGTLGGSQGFMIFISIFVYKDDPVPGAYTLSLLGTDDTRLGTSGTNYKSCGGLLSTPPNPCNSILEQAISTDFFASSKRIGRTQSVCGQYDVSAYASDGVTSPGHAIATGVINLPSAGFSSCATGVRGVVANASTDPTAATVYAYDSSTGNIVNGSGAGTSSSSASAPCNGGALPNDPPGSIPTAAPGSSTPPAPGGTGYASYGCGTSVGNTGFFTQSSPGWGDGRYYIRTNTGTSYKMMVTPNSGSGLVPRWIGSVAPNSWSTASVYTPAVGGSPLPVGDGAFAGALTNTVVAGTNVTGSVTRGGAWTTGTDQGNAVIYDSSTGAVDASATALSGNGSLLARATAMSSIKVRYEIADGAGNPNLVGWYKASGTPGENFGLGDAVAPGALVTNNFTSGSTVSGSLTASGAGSSVYSYRASDGQSLSYGSADASGNWTFRLPTAASAYKIYAVAPPAANLQSKWYNLSSDWTSATLVSAPSAANNMTLPAAGKISGYVKVKSSAADLDGYPVYAYSTAGAFVGYGVTNQGLGTGRYEIPVTSGTAYKVIAGGGGVYSDQWYSGSTNFTVATSTAAPFTANFSMS